MIVRFAVIFVSILVVVAGAKPAAAQHPFSPEGTSLEGAARMGDAATVELLLQRAPKRSEKNLALLAAAEGGPVVLQMDPAQQSGGQRHAVKPRPLDSPWTKTVKLLLDNGAYIETRDADRNTPVLLAASFGQTDIFLFLLKRGADIRATDKYGNSALIGAACECAEASMNSTYDIVKVLLEKGAEVNAQNHEGTTALMNAAAGGGSAGIVKLLLDHGADANVRNERGETALALARKSQRPDKVRLLRRATQAR